MNEIINNMKSRRTCRKFLPTQVRNEDLDLILEAGMYAPSGMGRQSPIFLAIQDKEIIAELSKINTALWGKGKDAFFGAPTVIVVLSNPEVCHTYQLDAMGSVVNMLNAAESLGLGAACISRAKEEFETEFGKNLLKKYNIHEKYVGIEHVILGYRDGEVPKAAKRNDNRIYKIMS